MQSFTLPYPLNPNVEDRQPRQHTDGVGQPCPSFSSALLAGFKDPQLVDAAPQGANDWSCKPTSRHPYPVLLIHGYFSTPYNSWSRMAPYLRQEGYCVFTPTYTVERKKSILGKMPGAHGMADQLSATQQLSDFIDEVLEATGAEKVSLVGWSQGALLTQLYLHYFGGAHPSDPRKHKVSHALFLAGVHHGTYFKIATGFEKLLQTHWRDQVDIVLDGFFGEAARGFLPHNERLADMRQRGETFPGINYTNIYSSRDRLVTPSTITYIDPQPGHNIRNICLQDLNPHSHVGHTTITYDPTTINLVRQALDQPISG